MEIFLIVDWTATFLSFSFLAGGLISLYVAKHPTAVLHRFGMPGLALGTLVTFLFAGACLMHGGFSCFTGNLLTPNGEAFTGTTAYAGAAGFIVLGLFLGVAAWNTVRSLQFEPAHSQQHTHGGVA